MWDSLKRKIKEVFPLWELPDLRFDDMKNLKGTDLIVERSVLREIHRGKEGTCRSGGCGGSRGHVETGRPGSQQGQGLGRPWRSMEGPAMVSERRSRKDGPWNHHGYVFITGAMGNMLPGKRGIRRRLG